MKLQVVVIPVADVDRAKDFYLAIGFREIYDHSQDDRFRIVHLTPPGSEASIVFGTGVTDAAPGSIQGLVLVVHDIAIARVYLTDRGVDISVVFHDIDGVFYHVAPEFEVPGLDPARRDYRSYARFRDPDGNTWLLQEVRHPARGFFSDTGCRRGNRRAGSGAEVPDVTPEASSTTCCRRPPQGTSRRLGTATTRPVAGRGDEPVPVPCL